MNRFITALLLAALSFSASAEVWQARYGVEETFDFKLYNADGTLDVDEVDGGTEVSISCNEGAETTATNDFVDEGTFYSIVLTAAELQCERISVVVAATTTEVFFIQTSANASAMTPAYEANMASGTAGAITAAVIATGAIDADALATDAVTEINATILTALGVNITTIATLTNQTTFTLTAGSVDNGAYGSATTANWAALFIDQSTSAQRWLSVVDNYVGSTLTVTLRTAPGFAIATGDTVVLIPAALAASFNIGLVEGVDASDYFDTLVELLSTSAEVAQLLTDQRILIGTCDSGSTTTCVDDALTQAAATQLEDRLICFDDSWCALISTFAPGADTATTTKIAPSTRASKAYTIFPSTLE